VTNRATTENEYGLTPAQYHAGLDKLWRALGLRGTQSEDVFTLAAQRIRDGDAWQELAEARDDLLICYRVGRRPSEKILQAIAKAKEVLGDSLS